MTPELCSSLFLTCDVLLVGELGERLHWYALKHFGGCAQTEGFGSWPLHRVVGLVSSDDLVAQNEEEVLVRVCTGAKL